MGQTTNNPMKTRHLYLVLIIIFLVQTAHFAEHVAQLIQIYGQGIKPPEAHGLLGSVFDFEWVHFLYNIGLEVVLIGLWLGYRRVEQAYAGFVSRTNFRLLGSLALFQGYHSVEHIVKLYQYLFIPLYQSGQRPTPGILPQVTGWPIFLVHFGFNLIVWAAMAVTLWRLRPPGLRATTAALEGRYPRAKTRLVSLLVVLSVLATVAPQTQTREALSSVPAVDFDQFAVAAAAAVPSCSRVFLPLVMRNSTGGGGTGGPDFVLRLNPECVEVSRGGNVTTQVNVVALNAFSGTVNLTLEGAPSGVTGAFSASSINTSGSSNLSLSVGSGVLPGTYILSVKGTSGSLVRTATLMLIVLPAVTIVRTSPANGEGEVAVTRETIVEFGKPISLTGIITDTFSAQFGGQTLAARRHLSPDRLRVTLFYSPTLPASARVRVTVIGDNMTDDQGARIDADGDSVPGGTGIIDFDTLSLSRIPGTDVWGYVYDSYNKNLDGSDRPVVGATIRVDGFPEANAVTDQNGYFILQDMPAPMFFVHIDGSTAINAPPGTVYATVGKPFHSVAGQSTQLTMDGATFNIYLPPMSLGDIEPLSSTQETDIGFGPAGKAKLVEMFPTIDPSVWDQTQVMFPPNSAVDDMGNPATQAAIIPVPSDRLPAPLSPGLNHQLDIAVIAPGASNFDTPAPACFPNLPDPDIGQPLPPGEKAALISFNHDTGQWEVAGSMTVSADGKMVCTDPDVGIRAPGWHGVQQATSGNGGNTQQGCKPSPGGNDVEEFACRAVRPLYCEAKFGSPCRASCEKYINVQDGGACLAECVLTCSVWHAQCLASTECPFEPPDQPDDFSEMLSLLDELQKQETLLLIPPGPYLNSITANGTTSNSGPQLGLHYYMIRNRDNNNVLLRGITGSNGVAHPGPVFLAPNTNYREHILQAATGLVGYRDFRTPGSGQQFKFPDIVLGPPTSLDTDGDGMHDYGEFIVGTNANNPDSDSDGVSDGAEIVQGTNPLDGLPAVTGIIASADTLGTAVDIAAFNDIAVVADSDRGVSVLSVINGTSPVIIAQVDTPGNAQAVAFFSNLVAVADGTAGLAIIDVTDPPSARIIHQIDLGGTAQAVTTAGRVAYVGFTTGQVVAVDMTTGTELGRVTVGSAVVDVALGGDYLYVLTAGTLYAVSLDDLAVTGSVASPLPPGGGSNQRLFVGGGIAYVTHFRGYNTFSLANPAQPALIAVGNTQQAGWKQIVANGSGLGVAVVGVNLSGDKDVYLYDVSNPAQTNNFLTLFQTPGVASAVALYNGLAYVADSQSGMQVVNYLAYDSKGISPTITLTTNFAGGVAEEGKTIRATAVVSDDVQVRNVEFYVDGVKAATDGNFPFEHRFITPLRSQQSSFTLRAKATDTGGNLAWTDVLTLTLVADATPPQVRRVSPRDNSKSPTGSVSGISATFSEPISTTTVTTATLRLFNAGPDGLPGTADDVLVTGGALSYRDETNTALLTFSTPLPDGLYRAVISSAITDLAGRPLAGEFAWIFGVAPPVFWVRDADGFWDVPTNWSTGAVPGPDDTVIISRPAGNFTITHRFGNTSIVSLRSSEAIVLSGGSLSISATAQISNAFTFTGGTLAGSGDMMLSGSSTWTGGTLSGPGAVSVGVSGTLVISGSVVLNTGILNNAGTSTWTGVGNLTMGNGAVINNLAGGLFDAQNDAAFFYFTGAAPTFNNAGIFRKSGGTGTTSFGSGVTFSGGNVEVLTGTLSLAGGGTTTTGGTFTVASGAVLDLTGGTSRTYVGNYTGTGAGVVRLGSGTLQVGAGGVTFNVSGGGFRWTGGTLTGPGILTNTGTLVISGTVTLNGNTLNNAGSVTWTGTGNINMGNGAVLNNLAGGLFDAQNDATFVWIGGATPAFNNAGLFRKSVGAGTTTFGNNVTFSGGNVEVLTGTLSLAGGGTTTTGGTFTVASGAVLDLTGGSTRTYVGNYTGAGAGVIRLGSGTLQVGAGDATFNFSGGGFQWTGGTLTGPGILTNTGTLVISGTVTLNGNTLNNAGSVTWTGTGNINMGNGAVLNNLAGGLFDAQNNATFVWTGGAGPTINNLGLFRKSAGTGTTTLGSNVAFNNTGTVTGQTGALNFGGGYTQSAGTTNLSGGNIAGSGTLNFQGGSLSGAGLITATVAITGQVNPGGVGASGVLTITGNYVQAAAGVLNIELGGLSPAQYDRLNVTGSATLNGTLNASLINGFTPSTGNSFQVMTYGSRTGTFATINCMGWTCTPNYNPANLTLVAQ